MVRGNRLSLLCGVALLLGFCAVASARLVAGRSPEEFLPTTQIYRWFEHPTLPLTEDGHRPPHR